MSKEKASYGIVAIVLLLLLLTFYAVLTFVPKIREALTPVIPITPPTPSQTPTPTYDTNVPSAKFKD